MKSIPFHRCAPLKWHFVCLLMIGATTWPSLSLIAKEVTWSGSAGPENPEWSDSLNWVGGIPAANDDLVFGNSIHRTALNDLDPALLYGKWTFAADAGDYTLNGSEARLSSGVFNLGTASHTIDMDLALSAHQMFDTGSGAIIIRGDISSTTSSQRRITKEGTGTLTLMGSNSNPYHVGSPNTFIHLQGTVVIGHDQALGGGRLQLGDGATAVPIVLKAEGARTIANDIYFNRTGTSWVYEIAGSSDFTFTGNVTRQNGQAGMTISVTNTGKTTFEGDIVLAVTSGINRFIDFRIAVDSDVVISGKLTDGDGGVGNLVKSGGGRLTLTGDNTYTGDTTIDVGTLWINGSLAAPISGKRTTVNAGGALGGSGGTIEGIVVVESGGAMAFELNAEVIGLTVGGLTLEGDHDLRLTMAAAVTEGDVFNLLINAGETAFSGRFTTINGEAFGENDTFLLEYNEWTYQLQTLYQENSISVEVMSAIPEPNSVALLLIVGLGVTGVRILRHRRKVN